MANATNAFRARAPIRAASRVPARHNRQVLHCGTYPVARYVVMRPLAYRRSRIILRQLVESCVGARMGQSHGRRIPARDRIFACRAADRRDARLRATNPRSDRRRLARSLPAPRPHGQRWHDADARTSGSRAARRPIRARCRTRAARPMSGPSQGPERSAPMAPPPSRVNGAARATTTRRPIRASSAPRAAGSPASRAGPMTARATRTIAR